MTLDVVDYKNSKVTLTNYGAAANQQSAINLPVGDYAWVIQSKNASYGDTFTLQYNMSLPMNTSRVLYLSDDYQKIYRLDNGSLKLNEQARNLDYNILLSGKPIFQLILPGAQNTFGWKMQISVVLFT